MKIFGEHDNGKEFSIVVSGNFETLVKQISVNKIIRLNVILPAKMSYKKFEPLNLDGMSVWGINEDNTTIRLFDYTVDKKEFDTYCFNFYEGGDKFYPIQIKWGGYIAVFNVWLSSDIGEIEEMGLNVYVGEGMPVGKIEEGSIWIKRYANHKKIYIFDKIDSDDDFDNSILIFTRDGFELVNLYSGEGFTSELRVRQIQYSNGELVQILPYWIYRSGEWVSTENTRTQGVKLKLKNSSINVNNDFNQTQFVGVETILINEVENEYEGLTETFKINVNEVIEIGLSSMNETITI